MPTVFLETPDSGDGITRSITVDVVKDLITLMNINPSKVHYHGALAQTLSTGSALGAKDIPDFGSGSSLKLSVTEELDVNGVYTSSMAHEEHLDIFTDKVLGMRVKPTYSDHSASIEFTFRAQSKTEVTAWRNSMRSLLERDFMQKVHSPEYYYPFDIRALNTIAHIHDLRESIAGYGDSLVKYLKDHLHPKVSVLTNVAGNNPTFMVNEKQLNIQGVFEFDIPPIESKSDGNSNWEVSFTYTVKYQKPSGVRVSYPISVHNQMISPKYRPTVNLNSKLKTEHTVTSKAFNGLVFNDCTVSCIGTVKYPVYDIWKPIIQKRTLSGLLQFLLALDLNDQGLVLDLKDLGPYTLKAPLLNYINKVGNDVFLYGKSAIHIEVHTGNKPFDCEALTISNGVIRSSIDLNPREVYHLNISLVHDLTTISDDAITKICDDAALALTLLVALEPTVAREKLIPTVVNGKANELEFRKALQYIKTTDKAYVADGYVDRVRSGYCTIDTGVNYAAT